MLQWTLWVLKPTALRADANHFESLSLRAAAKQFSNKYVEAIADYNLLEKKQGADFKDFYSRASCFQALKKHQEAILDWDKAIAKNNENYEPFCFRGASKYALGKVSEAILDFNKALETTILKMDCNAKIGCTLVEFGLYKEAMPYLDKASEGSFNGKLKECKAEALKKMKK